MDVTQEIEQRVQQAAQAGADHCALCSISCVTSTLASVYQIPRDQVIRLNLCAVSVHHERQIMGERERRRQIDRKHRSGQKGERAASSRRAAAD